MKYISRNALFRTFIPTLAVLVTILLVSTSCTESSANQRISLESRAGIGGTPLPNYPSNKDFYKVPRNLSGPKGRLIRVQLIARSSQSTTLRLMYISENLSGRDTAVTGLITYPNSRPPKKGWPVVDWDHGTSGISQSCAPSRSGGSVPNFGVTSVAVATDYLGLGPDGEIHPYLNRITEARATIDIVLAARNIPDAHASSTWVVVGDSQGGHASLSTGELASKYASQLHLVGTVAIGPGSELSKMYPGDNPIVYDTVTVLALFGAQSSYPGVNPNQFLIPAAQGVAKLVTTTCVTQIAAYLLNVYVNNGDKIFRVNPVDTPQGRSWLAANEVGMVHTNSPILVIAGGQDPIVVPDRVYALMQNLCKVGDRVEMTMYPSANHSTEITQGAPEITSWIKARLDGTRAPTSCPFQAPVIQ